VSFFQPDHPMFKNPLVRWICVILPLGEAGVEFYFDSPGWGVIFLALGLAAFWVLIVTWKGNAPSP
jgi:hypothetical protein